jgi:predicted O-linked N-acetylglucosamine transferase (SPINDLY family)
VRHVGVGRAALPASRSADAQRVDPEAGRLVASALQLHQAGRLDEAEAGYRRVLALAPTQPDAWHLLGLVALQTGRFAEADAAIRDALKLAPERAPYWNSLGAVARAAGQPAEASPSFERAVALAPEYVEAWANLAAVWQAVGDSTQEAVALERLAALQPGQAQVWSRWGLLVMQTGQLTEAETLLARAVALAPNDPEAWCNIGAVQIMRGRFADAELSLRRAVVIQPDAPSALNNLGNALVAQSRWAEAADVLQRAVALAPDSAHAWVNLGHAEKGLERYPEAVTAYERALALSPAVTVALVGLGDALQGLGELDRAVGHYHRALAIDPADQETYDHLEVALRRLGRLVDAEVVVSRRAVHREPDSPSALSRLIMVLDLHEGAEEQAQQARRHWNEQFGHPARRSLAVYTVDRDPDRRLRVGYVSADFRHHSASNVILPTLRSHNREQVEIVCYSGVCAPDHVTEIYRGLADVWRDVAHLSDDELAALIRSDQVDILVDLSGHSDGNRLPVFARKPAPIQITAWGYATGTGLDAMDYLFADPTIVPPHARAGFTEEIVDLPSVAPYDPPSPAPPVAPAPVLGRGHITFGAFNRLPKLSAYSRDAWGQVLAATPTARLLVKCDGLADSKVRAWLLDGLAAYGVAPERVTIMGGTSQYEHLATHAEIDIMLDTFPHGGGVTTLDSFLMGVPVVTLLGERMPGRLSASLLGSVGLSDLVAQTTEQYVEIATALAGNLDRLVQIRTTLRERLLSSPLGDRHRYARAVEDAYRTLWRRWCASKVQG